jgi:hypothetical protein
MFLKQQKEKTECLHFLQTNPEPEIILSTYFLLHSAGDLSSPMGVLVTRSPLEALKA